MSQEDLEEELTVFAGSSPEEVSHAKQLWRSLLLLPPLESADPRHRLSVTRRQGTTSSGPDLQSAPVLFSVQQQQEERQRFEDKRRDIMSLLKRQRGRRIQKEVLSGAQKAKEKVGRGNTLKPQQDSDSETERQLVRQLTKTLSSAQNTMNSVQKCQDMTSVIGGKCCMVMQDTILRYGVTHRDISSTLAWDIDSCPLSNDVSPLPS
ncbi:UPF0722 protein C11orf88-like [Thalassophryne amazonica]|uniref:UPF0722 protein C11orf88-like n=1 Tax=Thalassophryne amazonica TaxID=390379 RepID=UPI001471D5C2|nr:UPF0722 protein C11orf88-like [Thalassophryne amazonica]